MWTVVVPLLACSIGIGAATVLRRGEDPDDARAPLKIMLKLLLLATLGWLFLTVILSLTD